MKELSTIQKAKAYDEAIERGKRIQNTPYTAHWDIMKEVAEHLLPALKESENDKMEKAILWCINTVEHELGCQVIEGFTATELKSWFKNQGEQSQDANTQVCPSEYNNGSNGCYLKTSAQLPSWSAEDENAIQVLRDIVKHSNEINENIYTTSLKEKLYDWLKDLKDRFAWMPSDEQIESLEWQVKNTYKGSWQYKSSKELLEDLKKLRKC